jgi:hypothetical protein
MKRAQLSIDLLFAITLISLTAVSLISLSTHEAEGARTFGTLAQLKVFSIDLRDTVTKVYSIGDGFSVQKRAPFSLGPGENITVTLNASTNSVEIRAVIGGRKYKTAQQVPVPIVSNSSVTLNSTVQTFWVVATYNETAGMMNVTLSQSP